MLSETGKAPRRSPLRGRYFVHFLPLNLFLRLVDLVLAPCRHFQKKLPASLPLVPKILVSQPGHLGDLVIATAVIEPLRRLFPDCQIGFLVPAWAAPVLTGHADVYAVHIFDQALLNRSGTRNERWLRHRKTRGQALREVRASQYDIAIELSFNFPNNILFLYDAGIPIRIGYTSGGFGSLLTHPVPWLHHPEWSVMRYHEGLIRHLAGATSEQVFVTKSKLPQGPGLDALNPGKYTVVHIGSGGPVKEWPAARWADLIELLLACGRQLVFTGSGQREGRQIAELIDGRVGCIDLSGRLGWPQFVGVISRAELLVGVDSAAGHVAAAFDVPTLTIGHGLTDYALYKPQSPVQTTVREAVACAPCYRSRGCPSMNCIRDVSAQRANEFISQRLSPNEHSPASRP